MASSTDSDSYKSLPDGEDAKRNTKANDGGEPKVSGDAKNVAAGGLETPECDQKGGANSRRSKFSRAEKKARRMLIKQGSQPLPNVSRIVMRQANLLFIIDDAEIYKNANSETFIVFGEVRIEDLSKQKEQVMEYNQIRAAESLAYSSALGLNKQMANDVDDDGEAIDETDMDEKDIELVMTQAGTTRARAIRALRENDNDIVNTIMALTT